jgi:SAM-dependent methyltransferase
MPAGDPGEKLVPGDHPDRLRWNARYADRTPSFIPHPLAIRALAMDLPGGPVADLACGPSGDALLAAANGRPVTAVDVSDVALRMLADEAGRRGLGDLITLVHADLSAWPAEPRSHALVLCVGFWDRTVFAAAAGAVADGGLLGWEALTAQARSWRPSLPADWCLGPASRDRCSRRISPSSTSMTCRTAGGLRDVSCWPGAKRRAGEGGRLIVR